MPTFAASLSMSGRAGLNSGRHSKMRMNVGGVAEGPAVAKWSGPSAGGRPGMLGGLVNGPAGRNPSEATFNSQAQQWRQFWRISGVTRDSAGVAVGNCAVRLFNTEGSLLVHATTSDASGNFRFDVDGNASARFLVAYKAGSPDVAGVSLNTLIPVVV